MSPPPVRVQRVGLDVGAAPLRRLTRSEYNFTVQELFREATLQPANGFAPDEVLFGFAAGLGVPPLLVDQYCEAAARLAAGAVRNLPGLLGCNVAATGEDACTRRFIDGFGGRAYRGPLADEQRAGLRALYRSSKAAHGFAKGQEIPSPRNASGCGVFRVGERCYSL